MKTEKLYEINAYKTSFSATVLGCEQTEKGYAVLLDKTLFFPEQGGQYADKGNLNGINVDDVQIVDDEIRHYLASPLSVGMAVEGKIDGETRFKRMQTHTGEHILSGVIHNLYGYENVGFHLGEDYATVDTSSPLSAEQIAFVEREVNKIIWEDRPVTASYPSLEELTNMNYRSKIAPKEGIRLITIEGCDVCACCAPHLSTTGQVGCLKIVSSMAHRGGTRLTVLCGKDAYDYFVKIQNILQTAQRSLSATPDTFLAELKRLTDRLSDAEKEIKALKLSCAKASLSFTDGKTADFAFLPDTDFDTLRRLSECFSADKPRAIFAETGTGFSYALFSEKTDVRPLVKELNAALNGKGGGNATFAQGKLNAKKEDVAAFLLGDQSDRHFVNK